MTWKNPFKRNRSRDAPAAPSVPDTQSATEAQNASDIQNAARKQSKKISYRRLFPPRLWSSGDYSLMNNEAIFAAVTRISNTFAMTRFHLYKDRVIQKDHPMERLMSDGPNDTQTAYMYQQTLEAFRNTTGNAYAYKVPKVGGGVKRIDIIDPAKVTPLLLEDTGDLWYRLDGDKETIYVHGYEMIHTRYVCTNGYKGISPVSVLFNTLEYDEKIKQFSLSQLESGIHSPITLDIPSEVDGDKKDEIVEDFLKHYKKSGGSLIVLDAGAKASRLAGSVVDAKVFDVEKITRNRVATVYNIPPHMMGDYTDSSYQTNEQSMLEFLQLTMLPIFTMYAQEYDKKLLTANERQQGYYFAADHNGLMIADAATRAERDFKKIRSAGITPNEQRRDDGKPDIPGGDMLMVSRDLVPLDILAKLGGDYENGLRNGGETI